MAEVESNNKTDESVQRYVLELTAEVEYLKLENAGVSEYIDRINGENPGNYGNFIQFGTNRVIDESIWKKIHADIVSVSSKCNLPDSVKYKAMSLIATCGMSPDMRDNPVPVGLLLASVLVNSDVSINCLMLNSGLSTVDMNDRLMKCVASMEGANPVSPLSIAESVAKAPSEFEPVGVDNLINLTQNLDSFTADLSCLQDANKLEKMLYESLGK